MGGRRTWTARVASAGIAGAGLAVAAGFTGSDLIRTRALAPMLPGPPPGPRVRVEDGDDEHLVLTQPTGPRGDLSSSLVLGVDGPAGYGQLVEPGTRLGQTVTRRYVHVAGERPRPGDELLIDMSAFRDVEQAIGVGAMRIEIETEVGPIRALHVPGGRREWAILVHGRIGTPAREPLRMLRPFARRGHPALLVGYRNAAGAPRAPRGISRFGLDEWADIDAAIATAVAHGAERVVIGGISMGGAIAMATALRHRHGRIAGLVLDSPVLDLWSAVAAGASRSVPGGPLVRSALLGCARPVARARFGLDWGALDFVADAGALSTPILLFHGSGDRIAPVEVSDELAARRPDLVTYRRAPDIGHVRSWNAAPAAYEEAITGFLSELAP